MRRLISKHPDTGTEQWFVSDPSEGKFRLETVQNVTPYLEAAKASYNSIDERARWGEWAKVMTIPTSMYFHLKRTGIADDPIKMKRWMNDRDNRLLRTRPGIV
jgi:hypothetical protein